MKSRRRAAGPVRTAGAPIARARYITAREQRVVILRAFVKKAEKTPAGEIELALQRAKELK
jgi:phage-related protein